MKDILNKALKGYGIRPWSAFRVFSQKVNWLTFNELDFRIMRGLVGKFEMRDNQLDNRYNRLMLRRSEAGILPGDV